MKGSTTFPLEAASSVRPLPEVPPDDVNRAARGLHLVGSGEHEKADRRQQRQAFQARCADVAHHLSRIGRMEDRIEFYRMGVVTRRELTTAAALYPERMPKLNGEWEWIAITLADNEDD